MLRKALVILLISFIIGSAIFVLWAATPSGAPMPEALAALESDAVVKVTRSSELIFEPIGKAPRAGFIYYPGGRVPPEAYAPTARALAQAGYLAVIVPMPLNLAILNVNAADAIIERYPNIRVWAIGGHSLGGAMAARYAAQNAGKVQGLAVIASYPEANMDMSARTDLAVSVIYGTQDGLALPEQVEGARALYPESVVFVRIEGGNHAQFGWYGRQDRDKEASITHAEQQAQVNAALLALMARLAPSD
ncbi:MAG: alpha/beta hydrolase [Candidatus Thermofonsia Clade 1 bacterium]|jgi:pimeloyl-ACP methyl ester carboxylesterase|uniref:Alpha/beta hydrolase n=1 Tax=Candidatus Thermofonsia Clade 1 bacterium TaxID=2364210 RepID=A0A2M8PBM7_9CHLR|nr:MAG: alpha/beta hydrolase [Candidatus Thermofonsia Clade 1 bacterium]RMF51191.1 MAG: alpha/beta hydrolase [Chloroflexota bacterium]